MLIAVASGKGGTGKTTLAVNLAVALNENGKRVTYADCDVEEPNGGLFLNPKIDKTMQVGLPVPQVDDEKCDGCGKCGEICRFSAIVVLAGKPLTFPELCHGCGGCALVCGPKAITEVPRNMGEIEIGKAGEINYIAGRLTIGEAMPVPLIREVKNSLPSADYTLIDAPPGTSCPVIEAVKGADFIVLITEPTPFGLNDLQLAVEMVREMKLPFGVALNRAGIGDDRVKEYCRQEDIQLLAEIPNDRRIAEAYSRGELIIQALPEYKDYFTDIIEMISGIVNEQSSLHKYDQVNTLRNPL